MCRQRRPLDTPISHHIDFTGKKQWLEEAKKSHRVSGRDSALGLVGPKVDALSHQTMLLPLKTGSLNLRMSNILRASNKTCQSKATY